MYHITKKFRFEAAHRLIAPYSGKCSNLHGHCWVVKVHVRAPHLDERGFVKDFVELKPLEQWIRENLDHGTLVSERDLRLLEWLEENSQKHYLFPVNPTSEAIAKLLFDVGRNLSLEIDRVEIRETSTASAGFIGVGEC